MVDDSFSKISMPCLKKKYVLCSIWDTLIVKTKQNKNRHLSEICMLLSVLYFHLLKLATLPAYHVTTRRLERTRGKIFSAAYFALYDALHKENWNQCYTVKIMWIL